MSDVSEVKKNERIRKRNIGTTPPMTLRQALAAKTHRLGSDEEIPRQERPEAQGKETEVHRPLPATKGQHNSCKKKS